MDTNDPQTNHFWPSFRSGFPKKWVYKGTQSIFVTHSLSSFTVEGSSLDQHTYLFQPVVLFHSLHTHSSWIYCYCCYYTSIKRRAIIMPSAQNAQALPPIDPGLRPNYYRTTLPNLSYPYCPNSHILCPGSSAPLLFSVSLTFFFVFCDRLTPFALRKPRVLRW